MKILIVGNFDVGLFKFRRELLVELVKEHDVYISLPKGDYYDDLIKIGCNYLETNIDRRGTNPFTELKLISFYKKQIGELKPDIVFTYTIKPNIYAGMACASLNIPYVENITGLGAALEEPGILRKITVFLYKRGLRKAQRIFFQNTDNAEFMIKRGMFKAPYSVLPGSGVNVGEYTVEEYPKGDTVKFLFAARIMKDKGAELFFEIAERIRAKYSNTEFHICGMLEENYEQKINELCSKNVLIYHGQIRNMCEMYHQMSCIIHPSYHEGMSNVMLEASACGRPIIATNIPGCKEIVDDEVNGFLVQMDDLEGLMEKVEKFLTLSVDERKEMGLKGREKVEKEFDRSIIVNSYLEELKKI